MKRILFLDHTPFVGGAQLVLADHIEHLDRSEYHPIVACTDRVPSLLERYREAGAEVHTIQMERLNARRPIVLLRFIRGALGIRRLVRRLKVDLVVANTSRAAYLASAALLGTRVPLIWWVRDFLYKRRLFSLLSRTAARIVCVSEAIRDYYGGDGDRRFAVVYVGSRLHERLDGVTDTQLEEERRKWGIGPDDIVVGFMGRLVADKGPQDVVAAVEQVHERHPTVKLLVVGTGSGQEGDVESDVRRLIRERGMGSYVITTGYQSNEALFYSLFDIYVLSTRTDEPFATTVVQAMMAGSPVVATATGGSPEIVTPGETGLLVPSSNPTALAGALRQLIEDRDLARKMARQAQEFVLEFNREEVTTSQVEKLYEEVLCER